MRIYSNHHIKNGYNTPKNSKVETSASFNEILKRSISTNEIKISKHAEERLQHRNITLNDVQMQKINHAFELASQKNIKDSLVLMDDLALVVNVQSKTIVTAMEQKSAGEKVFTNIDGTIIL